ncbi:hypothetical protein [Brevibacillus choshinensis]|uniref:hypothetical protein n=1 Tax=Brevibacillus choshinensis TaxID=54911 RepID=UPI002E1E968F|nr:hypothetical protein [Brevibacillus choshinensis]
MSGDRFDDILVYNEDGTIGHAEVRIGDSVVMMFDAKEEWPDTPAFCVSTSKMAMQFISKHYRLEQLPLLR